MRKTVLPLLLIALIIATLLCLASPSSAAAAGSPSDLLTALDDILTGFSSAFAAIAEIIMTFLTKLWLFGGQTTRCCLGIFFIITAILSLTGLGAIRTAFNAYHRYLGYNR
jgi:type IV secretory pathway VirB2 component (pilin)